MGIGLSISRTIIEAHGGQLTVRSNPGGGTVFRFTLRAVRPEELGDAE
jgi:two-component system sensor kinase FixL